MQVGDLVRMGSAHGFRSGIVVLIDNKPIRGYHTIKVHFLGHKIEKLNGQPKKVIYKNKISNIHH